MLFNVTVNPITSTMVPAMFGKSNSEFRFLFLSLRDGLEICRSIKSSLEVFCNRSMYSSNTFCNSPSFCISPPFCIPPILIDRIINFDTNLERACGFFLIIFLSVYYCFWLLYCLIFWRYVLTNSNALYCYLFSIEDAKIRITALLPFPTELKPPPLGGICKQHKTYKKHWIKRINVLQKWW